MTDADRGELNVVFDISMLEGIGASTFNRAGIFRVVDRLVLELARHPECSLSLSGTSTILDINPLIEKVTREYPELAGTQALQLWRPTPEFRSLSEALLKLKKTRGEGIGVKVRRKLLRIWASMIRRRIEFDASALPPGAIFHSPWDALPPRSECRVRGVRRALTIYDMTPMLFPQFFQGTEVFQSILKSIAPDDHVIAISECTKRDFCEWMHHDPARVHVTPLAADPQTFAPVRTPERIAAMRVKYGIADGPYLLSVNTIQPRKNLDHCIRSFARLVQAERLRDLSLVLVGDRGWKTREIDRALRSVRLPRGRIVVTGYVPDADLAALYSGALAFVYVSHYEGFGLPPLEAMQCGVPIIASNTSSLPEVVGDAGLLVSPTDADALCSAMLTLYRDTGQRIAYAARAAARAQQFSWKKTVDLTVSAYREIMGAPS